MIHGVDRRRSKSDVLWNYELLQLNEGKSTVEHFSFSSEPMLEYECQQFIKRQVSLNLNSSKVYQNRLTEATIIIRSPDRVVGIVTKLRAGRSGFRIPIGVRAGPYLRTGPRGPGQGRQIFRRGILKKSRLKYGMREKRLSTREKFKGDLC